MQVELWTLNLFTILAPGIEGVFPSCHLHHVWHFWATLAINFIAIMIGDGDKSGSRKTGFAESMDLNIRLLLFLLSRKSRNVTGADFQMFEWFVQPKSSRVYGKFKRG